MMSACSRSSVMSRSRALAMTGRTVRAMAHGIPAVNFGRGPSYRLGVEEELLLVDPHTHALSHTGTEVLSGIPATDRGRFAPDTYEAEVELKSPVSENAGEAVGHLAAM